MLTCECKNNITKESVKFIKINYFEFIGFCVSFIIVFKWRQIHFIMSKNENYGTNDKHKNAYYSNYDDYRLKCNGIAYIFETKYSTREKKYNQPKIIFF